MAPLLHFQYNSPPPLLHFKTTFDLRHRICLAEWLVIKCMDHYTCYIVQTAMSSSLICFCDGHLSHSSLCVTLPKIDALISRDGITRIRCRSHAILNLWPNVPTWMSSLKANCRMETMGYATRHHIASPVEAWQQAPQPSFHRMRSYGAAKSYAHRGICFIFPTLDGIVTWLTS